MKTKQIILGLAALTALVSAVTFVVFSVATIPQLSELSDRGYIERMQAITREIQTFWFLGSFMGAAVLLPAAAYMYRKSKAHLKSRLLVAASLFYIVGAFGITMAVNLPRAEALVKVSTATMSSESLAHTRHDFEGPWNVWHHTRTIMAVAAAAAVVGAVAVKDKGNKKEQ